MRIDGKSLNRSDVLTVNAVLDQLWASARTVSKEQFIQESWGPDAIELLVGGEQWIVCDHLESEIILYLEDNNVYVASRELFQICAEYSPLKRILWHFADN